MKIFSKDHIIEKKEDLIEWFFQGCKTPENWRIGTEHEKFAYYKKDTSYEPLPYLGDSSVKSLLNGLSKFGWERVYENNQPIALKKNNQSITLEPGGQIELSGAPLENIHQTCGEVNDHLFQLSEISKPLKIVLIGIGSRPDKGIDKIPWMPKERYKIMKNYMHTKGKKGIEMMLNTCTVQVNLDYSSENDMARKMRIATCLQPIATAIFANSSISNNKPNGFLSWRNEVWRDTDPDRCGVLPNVMEENYCFEKYVDFALSVPMYFVKREGKYINCAGMSFKDFMNGKLEILPKQLPNIGDWEDHLTTIFTDVRIKQFIEMRGADSGSWKHICALPALWVGLLYDQNALHGAEDICKIFKIEDIKNLINEVSVRGLSAKIKDISVKDLALEILKLSRDGLVRRKKFDGAGNDESGFLDSLFDSVSSGKTPAETLLSKYEKDWKKNMNLLFDDLAY